MYDYGMRIDLNLRTNGYGSEKKEERNMNYERE